MPSRSLFNRRPLLSVGLSLSLALASVLPADPAFAPAALAAASAAGGPALLDHLAEHAGRLRQPLAAVVLEARP